MASDDVGAPVAFVSRILEDVPQPVWVIGPDGEVRFTNPAATSALGYESAAELMGRSGHWAIHYLCSSGVPTPVTACPFMQPRWTGVGTSGADEWLVRRDGSFFPVEWWAAPIQLDGSLGVVLAFTDIAERRAMERLARERDAADVRAVESHAVGRRILESENSVRRQVTRDLHDGAQQRLVSVLIGLQEVRDELGPTPRKALEQLDQGMREVRSAIDELRELAAGTYPLTLTARGLLPALEELAVAAAIPVTTDGELASRLPEAIEVGAYFIVAEALTNTIKHANATGVRVSVRVRDSTLSVVVLDDGDGGAEPSSGGTGLIGMADRVAALEGHLRIESLPGHGTRLEVVLPIDGPSSGQAGQM